MSSQICPLFAASNSSLAWGDKEKGKVVQVLNRLTMGAKPGDFEKVEAIGVKEYIAQQMNVANSGNSIDRLSLAINSDNQLQEVLVDFWLNYFKITDAKHEQALRPLVFSHFSAISSAAGKKNLKGDSHLVSFALAQYFVADCPPEALVLRLARCFEMNDGDMRTLLTSLFNSPEFFDSRYQNVKYKSPLRFVASLVRAAGSKPDYNVLSSFLKSQGQILYGVPANGCFENTRASWLDSDRLLKRISFAGSYIRQCGTVPYEQIVSTVNGGVLTERTAEAINKTAEPYRPFILLASPDFMNY